MNRLIIGIFILAVCLSNAYAGGPGKSGGAFLRIGLGSKAVSMGDAFVAVADDPSSIYWNPAGLLQIKRQQDLIMHTEYLADTNSEYFVHVKPIDGKRVLAGSLLYLYNTDIRRDENRRELGTFKNTDLVLSAAYAFQKYPNLAVGLVGKLVYQKLDVQKALSLGIDLGGLYQTPIDNLKLGFAIQNLGTRIKFISESDPMPLNLRLGAAYKLLDGLTLAGDLYKPIDGKFKFNIGAEYWIKGKLALRAGIPEIGGHKAKFGVGIGFKTGNYSFDYAFLPYDKLGNTHRISVVIKFAPPFEIEVWPRLFSPDGDGIDDIATFYPKIISGLEVKRWKLNITTQNHLPVRCYTGMGNPPETLKWDGRNKAGVLVANGIYLYTFSFEDEVGNVWTTKPQKVAKVIKPVIFISVEPELFSPDGDGVADRAVFRLQAVPESDFKEWCLSILTKAHQPVRNFKGIGRPPATLTWDGRDETGVIVANDTYYYTWQVEDKLGNILSTEPQILTKQIKSFIAASVTPKLLSPDGDGVADTVTFSLQAKPESDFKQWSLNILTKIHQPVKSFKGMGRPPTALTWDGRDETGVLVANGNYYYIFRVEDKVGNILSTEPQILTKKIESAIGVSIEPKLFSPDGDGVADTVAFSFHAVPESDFEAWSLNILTEDHQIVKSFKGTGSPPVTLSWNGRGIKGIVEDGTYTCIFSFSDKVGNVLSTTPQKLIVQKTRIPILRIEEPETKIMITIIGKLFFKSGKVEIAPDAYQILHQVAEVIKKNLDKQIVINIEGHTDNKPISSRLVKKYPTNLALSEARAEAVRQYLVQQEGIPAQILKTIGYGDTRPVADNTTSQGRAKNRRVEIIEIRIITQEVELH